MNARRFPLVLMIGLLARVGPVGGQPPDPAASQTPGHVAAIQTSQTTNRNEPSTSRITPEDAIRLALEALERLATQAKDGDKDALLAEARQSIATAETVAPSSPWLHFVSGRYFALTGRQGDAIDRLRKFVETREGRNEWRAYKALGDLFVGEFPQLAKVNYDKAMALNPGDPEVMLGLSACAGQLGNVEQGLALARDAVAADGGRTVRFSSHLARLLRAAGRLDDAVQEAETALAIAEQTTHRRPDSRQALLHLDEQYELLIDLIKARLERAPTDVRPAPRIDRTRRVEDYIRLAALHRARGEISLKLARHGALRALEKGVARTDADPAPALLEQYALALAEMGRTDAAMSVFKRLLEVDPESASATEWLKRLDAGPDASDEPTESPSP